MPRANHGRGYHKHGPKVLQVTRKVFSARRQMQAVYAWQGSVESTGYLMFQLSLNLVGVLEARTSRPGM